VKGQARALSGAPNKIVLTIIVFDWLDLIPRQLAAFARDLIELLNNGRRVADKHSAVRLLMLLSFVE
jgi:hypothetical protein